MEELFERYRHEDTGDRVQEPRDECDMLPEEYEEVYGAQFSYDLPLIIFTNPRAVAKQPIDYDVSEYYFSAGLGLGIHKTIGLVVVFHRDPRKNFIIPSLLFERYAEAILCKMMLFREAIQLLIAKDELSLKLVLRCEVGEPGLQHTRGRLSAHPLWFWLRLRHHRKKVWRVESPPVYPKRYNPRRGVPEIPAEERPHGCQL